MVPSGQNAGGTHSVCSDGELQDQPRGHSVSLLEPGAQKLPGVQLVGETDPCSHHAPSGHVWFSNGVGHTSPARQSCCWTVPSGQKCVGVHGVCVDALLHSLPSSQGVCWLEPGGQKLPRSQGVPSIDSCGHISPAGHGNCVKVVGHMLPAGQGSWRVDPAKHMLPLAHAVGSVELGLSQ